AVDREQFAVAFRDGACETRRAIDQRHFAEQLPRAHILHQVAADADRHPALEDDVHQHPDLAFPHDGGPGFVTEMGVGTEHSPEIWTGRTVATGLSLENMPTSPSRRRYMRFGMSRNGMPFWFSEKIFLPLAKVLGLPAKRKNSIATEVL